MYKLYYWPIPGRGEFIRLLLEYAKVPYEDVARTGPEGMPAVAAAKSSLPNALHFAPPILQVDETLSISQTPVICAYLARKHGLMPPGDDQYHAIQLDLSVHDVIVEVHATHHPVDISLAYEDQKEAALQAAEAFCKKRLLRWASYFEEKISLHSKGNHPYIFGERICYVDLSLCYLLDGLQHAFPKNFGIATADTPRLLALRDAVKLEHTVAEYLKSDRKLPFSNGIFRSNPEADK
eukprot:GFKZ01001338.1.p1 GENE.GFKZ01001338.1~~GFKZ01001338.1.p1  ORF type:complete len:276 (+),score=32.74 GFKZ01001338.1:118-828(+)